MVAIWRPRTPGSIYILRLAKRGQQANFQDAPSVAVDPNRPAAEWAVSRGGFVVVRGDERKIRAANELPQDRFALSVVDLGGLAVTDDDLDSLEGLKDLEILSVAATEVTDAGFMHLRGLTNLRVLHMGGVRVAGSGFGHFKDLQQLTEIWAENTPIGNEGLTHLQGLKSLIKLGIGGTRVMDAGMLHLKPCQKLSELWLDGTAVTDAGLTHLREVKGLTRLDVRKTKVTAKVLEEFHAAVPGCRIEHDGGVIEASR